MSDDEIVAMARRACERGCGDGSCVYVKPTGMHTNGGCQCLDKAIGQRQVAVFIRALVRALDEATAQADSSRKTAPTSKNG